MFCLRASDNSINYLVAFKSLSRVSVDSLIKESMKQLSESSGRGIELFWKPLTKLQITINNISWIKIIFVWIAIKMMFIQLNEFNYCRRFYFTERCLFGRSFRSEIYRSSHWKLFGGLFHVKARTAIMPNESSPEYLLPLLAINTS